MSPRFRSLRLRLLLPLVMVSMIAAVVVAWASYRSGDRLSREQIETRYRSIEATLVGAPFPLTQSITQSLSDLTNTELITIGNRGNVINASIPVPENRWKQPANSSEPSDFQFVRMGSEVFLYRIFSRHGPAAGNDGVDRIAVLFNYNDLHRARIQAAAFPLATGFSTILLLSSITFWITHRLTSRLSYLQRQVNQIAEGHFDTEIPTDPIDELGLLGASVQRMSDQLSQMWQQLTRTQGEKLLHQLASGLAHQLRNSLTGARMAIELHQRSCSDSEDTSLQVAIDQIEQTEDYVRQLTLAAAGKQDEDRPERLIDCIHHLQNSINPIAKHRHVPLQWSLAEGLRDVMVGDGPSYSAAASNLILNAIEIGSEVRVSVSLIRDQRCQIVICDNGPGPPEQLADEIFEPFVTSKPEGLGLGLPLVRRTAQRHGGTVKWERCNGWTQFTMTTQISTTSPSPSANKLL
ncbi:membrane protein containing ATP-binding region, ATPase-like protein [Rhodopirellula maiorica SM1]|uniref:histidine kinase n=1 Tax=Rhodopirellula maiorica SM1 TaxID=1265738 RepID=M5RIY0_9BACT|nr:HAMP domain-containing sensor histidine kinase [Rhodopirellula maiorica]EMI15312.1 membrane protein containing ATP-binding region, ATPase-like protein [Rhodopirellula maiorica SM1]